MATKSSGESCSPVDSLESQVEVTVLNLAGEPLVVVNLAPDSAVLDVKREIARNCGNLVEMQHLFYEELPLNDDQRTLREFGLQERVAVSLVLKGLDVDMHIERLRAKGSITEKEDIKLLCHFVNDIFLKESFVLEVQPPLLLAGNLMGCAEQLNYIFDRFGEPSASQYLFLGNHVSIGKRSIDTLVLLLLYKKKYPERMHLLRGRHEFGGMSVRYGFYDECKRNFNIITFKAFLNVFNSMPICALLQDRILCVPSGLSPHVRSIDQLRSMEKPTDSEPSGAVCDLLWSKFDPDTTGWSGCGLVSEFGCDFLDEFLTKNKLEMIICSDRLTQYGHESFHGDKLVSIHSTSNYLGEHNNRGAVLLMDEQLRWQVADYFIE